MVNLSTALASALLIAAAAAQAGTASLSSVTCGNNKYTRKQVDEATAEGCRLHASGQALGNNNYPHQFNNREGLVFAASGPYQEFPIVSSGNYTGRKSCRRPTALSPWPVGHVGSFCHGLRAVVTRRCN
jgi:hypothetical protein